MMSFFDEMASTISAAGKQTYRAAKEASEIGKLRWKISEEDRKLKHRFARFGVLCYASAKDGSERDLSEEIAEIDAQKQKLADLKVRLSELKNEKKCPNCGSTSAFEDAFCRKCGTAFEAENEEV